MSGPVQAAFIGCLVGLLIFLGLLGLRWIINRHFENRGLDAMNRRHRIHLDAGMDFNRLCEVCLIEQERLWQCANLRKEREAMMSNFQKFLMFAICRIAYAAFWTAKAFSGLGASEKQACFDNAQKHISFLDGYCADMLPKTVEPYSAAEAALERARATKS